MPHVSRIELVALCLLMVSLAGCADSDEQRDVSESGEQEVSEPYLPEIMGWICEPAPIYPETCEWVASMDAVAWVVVENIDFAQQWRTPYTGGVLVDECELGSAGIELTLSVDEVLFGEPPETLTATIGGDVAGNWTASPSKDKNAPIFWRGLDTLEAEELPVEVPPPIVEGQLLGVALHYDEATDRWATLGERLFLSQEDEATGEMVVRFQQMLSDSDCDGRAVPVDFDGLARSEFDAVVSACSSNELAEHRKRRFDGLFDKPATAFAGRCWSSERPDSNVECVTDDDCLSDQLCVDSVCSG